MEIVLLVGAAPFQLGEDAARWLERMIRELCVDEGGHPLDVVARACLQLADVIEEDLERGSSPEPIELGRLQVEGLLSYVLRGFLVPAPSELTPLHQALRRFRNGSV